MRGRGDPPAWSEVRGGLVILAALLIVLVGIFFVDDIRRTIVEGPRVVVVAPQAPQLGPGSEVWVAGQPAGRVTAVRLRPPGPAADDRVLVEAVIHRSAAPALRQDASASIHPAGLLGVRVLGIDPGSPGAPPFDFADTLRTPALIPRERVLVAMEELGAAAERSASLAIALERAATEGPGTFPAMRRDTALVTGLTTNLRRLGRLLAPEPEDGSLGRLAHDTAWQSALQRSAERLRPFADDATDDVVAPLRPAPLEELSTALSAVGTRLEAIEADLEEARGTAGRLLHDDELVRQIEGVRSRVDSVRVELLNEPLRWLRFRLF